MPSQFVDTERQAELASVKQQICKYTKRLRKAEKRLQKAKAKTREAQNNKKKRHKQKLKRLRKERTVLRSVLDALLSKESRLETGVLPVGALPADPDMQRYVEVLAANQDSIHNQLVMAGCTVALKDAFFLGNTMMGSEIFLRPCYVDTMKAIQLCEMERPGAVKVIIGTPGIGKTFLAALMVTKHLLEGKAVILHLISDPTDVASPQAYYRLKLGDCAAYSPTYHPFWADLCKPESVHVIDGGLPGARGFKAETLAFISPLKQHFRVLGKYYFPYKTFGMAPWSLEELQLCKTLVSSYNQIPEQLVTELYHIGGGNARTIFKGTLWNGLTAKSLADNLTLKMMCLGALELEDIYAAIGQKHLPLDCESILQWVVDEPNGTAKPSSSSMQRSATIQFASAFVAALAGVHHPQLVRMMCQDFVSTHDTGLDTPYAF